eukprot:INCI13484.11.p1 GENE.INCI13484.11~~INCI13484.11.p1  ORF type:complete len:1939 (-),score=365.89 INCI13484.11:3328-9144(-)
MSGTAAVAATATATSTPGGDLGQRRTSEALLKLRALKSQFGRKPESDDAAAKAKEVWFKHSDAEGNTYFFCRAKNKSQWTEPTGPNVEIREYKKRASEGEKDERSAAAAASPSARSSSSSSPSAATAATAAAAAAAVTSRDKAEHSESSPESDNDSQLSDASVVSDVWYKNEDPAKGVYFFNRFLNKSQWSHPGPGAMVRKFEPVDSASEDESVDASETGVLDEADDASETISSSASPSPRRRSMRSSSRSPRHSLPHPDFARPTQSTTLVSSDDESSLTANPQAAGQPIASHPAPGKYTVDLSSVSDLSTGIDDRPAEMLIMATPKAHINTAQAKKDAQQSLQKSPTWPLQPVTQPSRDLPVEESLWYRHKDKSGQTYYFNRVTRQSVWEEPTGTGVRILDYVRSQANKWRTATAAVVATRGAKNALKNQIVQAEQRANSAPQTSSVDSSGGPGSPAAMPATPKGHSGGPGSPAAMPATPKGHSGGPGSPAAMPATPKGQKSENRMPGSPSLKQKPPRESFPAVQTQDSVTDLDQIDENSDGESDDSDLDADDQAGGLVASGAVPLTTGPGTQGAIPATPRATGTDATGMRGLSSIPPLSTGPGTIGTIPRTPRRTQSELTGMAVPNMVGAPPLGLSPSSAVKGLPGAPPLVSPDGALANARVSSSGLDTPPFPTTPVGSRHSSSVDLRAQLAARVEQENRKGQEQARLVDNEAGGTDGARRTSHHGKTSSLVDSVFDAMELTDGDDDDDESDGHEDDSDGQHSPSMRPEQAKQPRSSDGARVRNLIMSRALGGNNSPMRGMDSVPTQVTESSSEEPNSDTSLNSPRLSPLPVDDGAPSTPDANGLIDLAGDTPFLKGRAADAPNNLAAALSSKVYGRSARQPRVEGEFGDSNRTTELLSVSFPENNDADDYESENSSGGESSPDVTAHLAAAQSAGGPPLTLSPLVTRNHISDSEDTVDNESEDEMADELSPLAARGAPRKDEFGVGSSRPTHVAPRQNKRMSIVTLKKRRTQSVKEESLRVGNKAMVAATDARLKRARMLATKLRVRARFALATSTDELDQRLAIVLWVQAAWRYRTMKTLNARQQKKRGVLEDRWLSRIGSGRAPPAKSQPGPTRQHRPRRGKSKAIQEQTEPEAELELQPEQEQEKEKEKEQEQVQEQEIEPEQFVGADAKSDSDDASISDDGTEDMLDAMANNAADESDDSLSDAEEPYMQDVSSDEGSSDQDLRPEQLSDHGKVEDEMLATIDAPVGTPSKPARMSRRMTLGEVVMDDVGLSPTNRKVSIETDSFLNDIKFHLGQRVRVLASYCQHHDAGAGVLNDAEEALLENARGNRAGVSGDEDFCEGIIRYSGEVDFASGQWFGVELLRPWGKNDGKVGNTRYFQCAGDRGIFLRPRAVIKSLVAYFVDHIDGLEYYKRLSAQMAESAAVAAAKKLEEQARIEAEREEMRRAAAEAALLAERRREADEALARLRDEQEKLQHAKKLADAEAAQAAELAAQREQAKTIAETDAQAPAPAPTEQASDSEAESQQDMSSGALKEFLLRCGLDQYIPRFVEQGYDDVGFLCSIAHEYPSLQKHIGADSEFANVTLNDLGLKKGHARQLLASLLGSTFDADSQKLVAKPASTDSAVSAWNSIIEADAPDDSSEEDHDAGHINESNMADEPDQSLSPIRSRPSPSPFKGVDSPLQSFLEPTEGSVEIAGERESESTFDEAPTLDDTKLHESSVAAEPSDTAAPSERAQPDSALRAAAELQRYCEQTAPTGMPAPDFQEAVFTVLKALHDQGKNVRNFEPWWKLLNYCYPQIKAQSLPEVGGGILIGVHEFTRGPHERQKSAGEFLEVLCDTLDEEGTFIPESVAAEILEACVTPEQLIQTWDAHGTIWLNSQLCLNGVPVCALSHRRAFVCRAKLRRTPSDARVCVSRSCPGHSCVHGRVRGG